MIERLIEKLKKHQEISDYRLTEVKTNRKEVYYIGSKVETLRNVKLNSSLDVVIYVNYDNLRGEASFKVFDSYSDLEIEEKILNAIKETNFSKNTSFNLPEGVSKTFNKANEPVSNDTLFKIAESVLKASTFDDGYISSMEVFLKEDEVHLVNSRGVNYTYFNHSLNIEFIPTFKNKDGEIELYKNLEYSEINYDEITKDVYHFLENAELRNKAKKYQGPNFIPVILNAEEIKELIGGLIEDLDYYSLYNNMNMLKVDDLFYGENHLDSPNIHLVPEVKGSIYNRPVDKDGIVLKDVMVVKDNKIINNFGDLKNGNYLGLKEITGKPLNLMIEDGSVSEEELKKLPHLEALTFSAFQFDFYSGNFGGELRLAKYYDGSSYHPVSGLTITGNIHELKSHLKFSKERKNLTGYSGPKCVLITSMNAN